MVKKKNSFMHPQPLSKELANIVGKGPLPRTEVVKKLWVYIKKHSLQDPKNKTMIKPDEKLSKVLGSRELSMFEMTKLINSHIG